MSAASSASNPLVSFVIVALNEASTLRRCIQSIRALDYPEGGYEIILVDGGSSDGTREIAKEQGAKVVAGGNIPESRNIGVSEAKGEYVAFVDADSVLPGGWIRYALAAMKEGVGCVGSHHSVPEDAPLTAKLLNLHVSRSDWLPTRGCVYRKEVLEDVGGFDDSLDTGEDWELGVRVSARGYGVVHVPEMSFTHLGDPPTYFHFFKKKMWWSKNLIRMWVRQGYPRRMLPNMAFALSNLAWAVFSIPAIIILLWQGIPWAAAAIAFIPLLWSTALALKSAISSGKPRYLPALILLYFIWGIAEAASIVRNNQLSHLIPALSRGKGSG